MSCLLSTTAQAEWYFGGYGGISKPGALSNTTVSDATPGGGVTNAKVNDLELKSGLLEGVKGGYFFESRPWLGVETDLYMWKPDVKQQTIVGGTSSGNVFAANLQDTSLRLSLWAVNLIIRSPSMSEVFQPYGGIGYGLFFATGSKDGQSNTQINPGFQFVAGARYVLTPEWAFFGEFKFNRATIRFDDVRGNYDSQLFVFGLMWHDRDKYLQAAEKLLGSGRNSMVRTSSRLRKNSLVHWAKPLESPIVVGVSEMHQHGLFACPDRSKCCSRATSVSFLTPKFTFRRRLKTIFPQPARATGEHRAGCLKRPSSKAATSEEAKAHASIR